MARRKRLTTSAFPSLGQGIQFAIDCQQVVALRMMRLAGGGAVAGREAERMVTEKAIAGVAANAAVAAGIMRGDLAGAMSAASDHYVRAVRRNRLRLSR